MRVPANRDKADHVKSRFAAAGRIWSRNSTKSLPPGFKKKPRLVTALGSSVENIWAFGDATGQHLFKHVANHEARVVDANTVLKEDMAVDYYAVPRAIFTHPEIASVGMKEAEAVATYGEDGVVAVWPT